ncbi:alpha-ketoacid dehydrogenase subunit beta [Nonomuraea sp. NPDC050663]|uniref:alpha-ketoacid dehydrogenase subunit beta n=1 Tax=Nonomuraea sp. NPDC050663 TaxID=3364370 RepID=UPI00379975F1
MAEHLNRALHDLLEADPDLHVLGEDISDPYGGAFKITKGLSSRFGDRIRSTPISEGAITGVGAGLALAGAKAIVEIMFADFVTLAFDQLANFAAKSTAMYGRPVPVPLIVRCPSGGNRGYGATHSQSPQKHFIGIPGLRVYELTPFHDATRLLAGMLEQGLPCVLFEDKVLYTRRMFETGPLFRVDLPGRGAYPGDEVARIGLDGGGEPDCTLIVPGGVAHRALAAAEDLLMEHEVVCEILVPARLHPLPDLLPASRNVVVAEESTAGGTWGADVAAALHARMWSALRRPVTLVSSADSVIPAAAHLEREVLLQPGDIRRAVLETVT